MRNVVEINIAKFQKKIGERLRKFLGNFKLIWGKFEENLWNFKISSENV